jgi:hypothetical protein
VGNSLDEAKSPCRTADGVTAGSHGEDVVLSCMLDLIHLSTVLTHRIDNCHGLEDE